MWQVSEILKSYGSSTKRMVQKETSLSRDTTSAMGSFMLTSSGGIDRISARRPMKLRLGIAAFLFCIMETCKMRGVNARDYVTKFFKILNAGRTDYAQMLLGLL